MHYIIHRPSSHISRPFSFCFLGDISQYRSIKQTIAHVHAHVHCPCKSLKNIDGPCFSFSFSFSFFLSGSDMDTNKIIQIQRQKQKELPILVSRHKPTKSETQGGIKLASPLPCLHLHIHDREENFLLFIIFMRFLQYARKNERRRSPTRKLGLLCYCIVFAESTVLWLDAKINEPATTTIHEPAVYSWFESPLPSMYVLMGLRHIASWLQHHNPS